jgi:hypothetical protein
MRNGTVVNLIATLPVVVFVEGCSSAYVRLVSPQHLRHWRGQVDSLQKSMLRSYWLIVGFEIEGRNSSRTHWIRSTMRQRTTHWRDRPSSTIPRSAFALAIKAM